MQWSALGCPALERICGGTWVDILGDATVAAMLDLLLDRSVVISIDGESSRLRRPPHRRRHTPAEPPTRHPPTDAHCTSGEQLRQRQHRNYGSSTMFPLTTV